MDITKESQVQENINAFISSHGSLESLSITQDLVVVSLLSVISITLLLTGLFITKLTKRPMRHETIMGGLIGFFSINTFLQSFLIGNLGMYAYTNWNPVWHFIDYVNTYTSFRFLWGA